MDVHTEIVYVEPSDNHFCRVQLGDFTVKAYIDEVSGGGTSDEIRSKISFKLKEFANSWPGIWQDVNDATFKLLQSAGKNDRDLFDSTSKAPFSLTIVLEPESCPGYYMLNIEFPDYLDEDYYIQWCKDFEGGDATVDVLSLQ